jgi:hypothetical protein
MRDGLRQVIRELESLEPVDPWVRERIAAYYRAIDDTVKALAMERSIAMPERWLFKTRVKVTPGREDEVLGATPLADGRTLDEVWADSARLEGGWRKATTLGTAPTMRGAVFRFTMRLGIPRNKKGHSVVCTQVRAPEQERLFLAMSLPAPHHAFLNGTLVGRTMETRYRWFDHRESYPDQPLGFDVDMHPITLRKGTNTFVVVFANENHRDAWQKYMRLAFRAFDGTVRPVADMALKGTQEDDHGEK